MKKSWERQAKKSSGMKMLLGEKARDCMSNGRTVITYLIAGLFEGYSIRTSQNYPEPYDHFDESVKVELDLSSYATKADLERPKTLICLRYNRKQIWLV